jgi:predicted short-subunit dehydrogenase-like oxidoreductase (DUF2520 family)
MLHAVAQPSATHDLAAADWRRMPLALVGAGAAGGAIARAWHAAGGRVAMVSSRSQTRAAALAAAVGARAAASKADISDAAIIILAVPDAAIAEVTEALSWRNGQIAVHLSGALGADALAATCAQGVAAVAWHPLCAFARSGEPRLPAGVRFGYSGPVELEPLFAAIARDLGGAQIAVPNEGRPLYHAAAVLASNDLIALAAAAVATLERSGVAHGDALPALLPLMRSALDNLASVGLPAALTGPLVRGDMETVERHRQALAATPELRVYEALAAGAARIALQRDDVPERARAALVKLAEEG